jgi:cellulose synthase/poly-beta-1,6-N-acetylglucosamine synthase-like glycosyltransferase
MLIDITHILVIICSVVILKDILLIVLFVFNFRSTSKGKPIDKEFPFVSILIAARNEENNISRCVQSLRLQDYPANKYEILVGNDGSEDQTLKILRNLESITSNMSVYDIQDLIQAKPGKMNVLAQLGLSARGEILLFTDADTRVPKTWIKSMVNVLRRKTGFVTGTTLLETNSKFDKLQRTEWVHAICMMKVVSDLNIDVSSIGNNMAITKEAYDAVGGFRDIPFSITEDYEIFRQVCKKGYSSFHIFQKSVLATSIPASTFWGLLIQRKRWMTGAFKLPVLMLALLILNTLYYPLVMTLIFLDFEFGILLILSKIIVQGLLIHRAFIKLEERSNPVLLILYELYAAIVNLWAFLVFIFPIPIKWRGRKY